MRSKGPGLATVLALVACGMPPLGDGAQDGRFGRPLPTHDFTVQRNVPVPMRDGVSLSADIYLPVGDERFPVLVMRTPYNKERLGGPDGPAEFFAGQGYAVVAQDVRGKYASGGEYTVQSHDRDDGFDTVDWAAKQTWSTGKVGTYGCSYLGEVQVLLAGARHPSHLTAVPQAAAGGLGAGGGYWSAFGIYQNGVLSLSLFTWFLGAGGKDKTSAPSDSIDIAAALWTLPVIDMVTNVDGPRTDWEDFVKNRPGSTYWGTQGYASDTTRFDVPALHVNSWFDYGAEQTLYLFDLFSKNAASARAHDNQYIIISPATHCQSEQADAHTTVGELDVGDTRLPYWTIYRDWFDFWLKGLENGILERPKVQYYVIHEGWRSAPSWPPPESRTVRYYLASNRGANSAEGDGMLDGAQPMFAGRDTFTYNPDNPIPSRGGFFCCSGDPADQPGMWDQSDIEARHDVLVYTSTPLSNDLTIAGPVRVELFVSSDALDTDFTAKLVDLDQEGKAWNVADGIARVRYRRGLTEPELMEPGRTYQVILNLNSTAFRFRRGHRIRLDISSSNFPQYERNTNTGGNIFDEDRLVIARNVVYFGGATLSALLLPVLQREP